MTAPDDSYDGAPGYWEDEDGFDNNLADCALMREGGVYLCGKVGSEECEFDCPLNNQIGRKRWYTPRQAATPSDAAGVDGGAA